MSTTKSSVFYTYKSMYVCVWAPDPRHEWILTKNLCVSSFLMYLVYADNEQMPIKTNKWKHKWVAGLQSNPQYTYTAVLSDNIVKQEKRPTFTNKIYCSSVKVLLSSDTVDKYI